MLTYLIRDDSYQFALESESEDIVVVTAASKQSWFNFFALAEGRGGNHDQ